MIYFDKIDNVVPTAIEYPPNMEQEFPKLCSGREEISLRAFAFKTNPITKVARYSGMLTYDQHIAVIMLLKSGVQRHLAMELVDNDVYTSFPSHLVPPDRTTVKDSKHLMMDGCRWALTRSEEYIAGNPLIFYSAVQFDVASGRSTSADDYLGSLPARRWRRPV